MKRKLFYKIFAFTFGMMFLITVLAHVLIFVIAPSENILIHKCDNNKFRCVCFFRSRYAAIDYTDHIEVVSTFNFVLHSNFIVFFVFVF